MDARIFLADFEDRANSQDWIRASWADDQLSSMMR